MKSNNINTFIAIDCHTHSGVSITVLLGLLYLLLPMTLQSQQENGIDPVEIKVVKDYNVFIEEASKIHEPISYYPKFKEKTTQKKLSYQLPDKIEQFKFEPSAIEPIAYRQRNVFFRNTNFVKLGFGSALNPIFEWSHIQDKSKTPARVHVFHHSAWHSPDSFQKYSETKAEAEMTKTVKGWVIKPKLQAGHKFYHFFGNINESAFQNEANRNYMHGGIGLNVKKERSEIKTMSIVNQLDINYGMDKLNRIQTTYDHHEFYSQLKSDISYKWREQLTLKMQFGAQYHNLTVDTFSDKWLLNAMPHGEFKTKALKLSGGLNFMQTITNSKPIFYVFPHFVSEVQLVPSYLNFYTVWSRHLELNRIQLQLDVNPFSIYQKDVLPNTLVENRSAGLKGVYKGVAYQAFFNQKIMKNPLLFRNDAANPRFLVADIEKNMTVNNISLELSYLQEARWSAYLKGDIFLYELDNTPAIAYNLPGQRLSLGLNLKPSNKWNFNVNTFALGGVKTIISGAEVNSPILFDINFGAEYHISKNFYIFANGNNLLNSKIAPQVGFPTIGVNGQGGIRITY